jgi:type II restriction/modification system DNA methylase subunit YeeA
MTPQQFIATWKAVDLSERSAYQQHFLALCELLGEKKPVDVDPTGQFFTFEKGVDKTAGGKGFADVWRRGCFGWEYKGKHKDLTKAYAQLLNYREALENPPLLVVCDLDKFVIRTNFTGTPTEKHEFDLDGLADAKNLDLLRKAFADPYALKPGRTQKQVTEDVARKFAAVADGMQARNIEPHRAGHFLMKLMFCMFAEDIELLPKELFLRTLRGSKADPAKLAKRLADLFEAMANPNSTFGADEIPWVNGGLFQDAEVIELSAEEIRHLEEAAAYDWSAVEPSIFGTLFERIIDPALRKQLGKHYTGRDDILTLVEPVVLHPLRAEWAAVKADAERQWDYSKTLKAGGKAQKDARDKFEFTVNSFLARLAGVTVLDPACGSGNFLYVALGLLLDLEKEVLTYFTARTDRRVFPGVRPTQLRGIEFNPYAQQLAQVVIWIGFLQWMRFNGFIAPSDPVLDSMDNIENRDAVLDLSDPAHPKEAVWPDAEFFVGNPPFLGDKKMRGELGDEYVTALRKLYAGRLPGQSDLVCYWFEKARAKIEAGTVKRAGLIATQGIRFAGANRKTLERIKSTGDIFFAYADRDWILDGATVHISMVGFDNGSETTRILDTKPCTVIHANLTTGEQLDTTTTNRLEANANTCFLGVMKAGSFDINEATAIKWLRDANPHGKPNSDVLRPRLTARDILQRGGGWIVDFGCDSEPEQMALYAAPWHHVDTVVRLERTGNRRARMAQKWWLHGEARPGLRNAVKGLTRFVVTPEVSKHRVFAWLDDVYLADHKTRAFAVQDDYTFGVLHSKVHERWALAQGSQLRDMASGFSYTPSTCFETFPFPEPTDAQRTTIADAAKQLDTLRTNWLNPPEWVRREVLEFPGSWDGPWRRFIENVDTATGIGTVRYPRVVAKDAAAEKALKKRTLTNLYNERPTWLKNAHTKLDEAVLAAYGWPADIADDTLLAKLLELNLSRVSAADAECATDADEQ